MHNNSILLTHLHIRKFFPYLKDHRATDQVRNHYQTQPDAARVNKRLYPSHALKNIDAAARAARTKHEALTIPWFNDGTRALPAKMYLQYTQAMQECKTAFATAVQQFIASEPQYRAQDQARLTSLYNEDDYPSPEQIEDHFSLDIAISVVPDTDDIRFNLSDEKAEQIRSQIEQQMEQAQENWAKDIATRLYKPIYKLSSKLDDPEGIFKASSITNLRDLANVMKELNVMDDDNIDNLADEILTKVTNHEPDTLRADKRARAQAASDARKIVSQLENLYGVAS